MPLNWIVLIVFILVYGFLCLSKHHRAKALWIGIAVMVLARYTLGAQDANAQYLSLRYILFDAIDWNILGILAGAMMIAELFSDSKVPLLLADHLVDHCKNTHTALLAVCVLSGFISIVVDNVTTVLLVAPVALVVAKRANVTPVPFLIGIAISSNLQGAATLIGDPPSMLLATEFNLTFNNFFFYKPVLSAGYKPSMFFIIQAGAVASFGVLYAIFRHYRRSMTPVEKVKPTSWIPTGMIVVMITFRTSWASSV